MLFIATHFEQLSDFADEVSHFLQYFVLLFIALMLSPGKGFYPPYPLTLLIDRFHPSRQLSSGNNSTGTPSEHRHVGDRRLATCHRSMSRSDCIFSPVQKVKKVWGDVKTGRTRQMWCWCEQYGRYRLTARWSETWVNIVSEVIKSSIAHSLCCLAMTCILCITWQRFSWNTSLLFKYEYFSM